MQEQSRTKEETTTATEVTEEQQEELTTGQFISGVLRTESVDTEKVRERLTLDNTRLLHAAIGIETEAGEFLDPVKKFLFYGKPIDRTNMLEELGDLLFYVAVACDVFGMTFEQVMTMNQKKLRIRFPDKFTEEKAINRSLDIERGSLENSADQLS